MTLKATRFKDNARLQAAAKNSPAMRAFETDHQAVKILQRALRDLNHRKVGWLPKSFKNGAPDGIYGQETVTATRNFQKLHADLKLKDGIAGKNTLHKLDGIYFKPPKPVIPVTPPPEVTAPTLKDIKTFLMLRRKTDFASELVPGNGHNLVAFGEFHHASDRKGKMIAELIEKNKQHNRHNKYFFASEVIFPNQISHINRYMAESNEAKKQQIIAAMPDDGFARAREYTEAYDTIADFPGSKAHVIVGGAHAETSMRHEALARSFTSSANTAGVTASNSFGYYIIGAAHAARSNILAMLGGKTVTQRLIDARWNVHVVRLIVDKPNINGKDSDILTPIDESGERFDLQDILTAFSRNHPAYYDIRGPHSPFGKLTFAEAGRIKKPYNQFFDAVMFFPAF